MKGIKQGAFIVEMPTMEKPNPDAYRVSEAHVLSSEYFENVRSYRKHLESLVKYPHNGAFDHVEDGQVVEFELRDRGYGMIAVPSAFAAPIASAVEGKEDVEVAAKELYDSMPNLNGWPMFLKLFKAGAAWQVSHPLPADVVGELALDAMDFQWRHCLNQLERKDLGDIERKNYEGLRDKLYAAITKTPQP